MTLCSPALTTSHLAIITFESTTGTLEWEGFTDAVASVCGGQPPSSKAVLLNYLDSSSRVVCGQRFTEPSEEELPITFNSPSRWQFWWSSSLNCSGRFFLRCVAPETSSRAEPLPIRAINREMEVAVDNAHHRLNNTLQNVLSYISLSLGQRTGLTRSEVQKLSRYIQSLATLNNALLEEVRSHGDGSGVRLDVVLTSVLELNKATMGVAWTEVPPLYTTPRAAATLSLILNELLDNAALVGGDATTVTVASVDIDHATVVISTGINSFSNVARSSDPGPGLNLVRLLAQAELSSNLELFSNDKTHTARLQFPVLSEASRSNEVKAC